MKNILIAICVLFLTGSGVMVEAEDDFFFDENTKITLPKYYRIKLTKEATLDDVKFLLNEVFCVVADEERVKPLWNNPGFKLEEE